MTNINIAVNIIRVLTNHELELSNGNSDNLDQSANKSSNKAFAISQDNPIADEDKEKNKANNASEFDADAIGPQNDDDVNTKEK